MSTQTSGLPARPSIRQAADYLNVDPRTIRRYIAAGRLRAIRVGPRLIRLDRENVVALGSPVGAL
ncbi:MAG: helix-turn-helix domain-containing protein [Leucobacter sp.]